MDRPAQLRAASARSRIKKRQAGLRPHEHWYRNDEAPAVAEFFRDLEDKRQVGAEALVRNIVDDLLALSEDDRLEVFSNFCHHCGRNDPRCQCWNDD